MQTPLPFGAGASRLVHTWSDDAEESGQAEGRGEEERERGEVKEEESWVEETSRGLRERLQVWALPPSSCSMGKGGGGGEEGPSVYFPVAAAVRRAGMSGAKPGRRRGGGWERQMGGGSQGGRGKGEEAEVKGVFAEASMHALYQRPLLPVSHHAKRFARPVSTTMEPCVHPACAVPLQLACIVASRWAQPLPLRQGRCQSGLTLHCYRTSFSPTPSGRATAEAAMRPNARWKSGSSSRSSQHKPARQVRSTHSHARIPCWCLTPSNISTVSHCGSDRQVSSDASPVPMRPVVEEVGQGAVEGGGQGEASETLSSSPADFAGWTGTGAASKPPTPVGLRDTRGGSGAA
eukprot:3939677-Rhodomonas_salina.1